MVAKLYVLLFFMAAIPPAPFGSFLRVVCGAINPFHGETSLLPANIQTRFAQATSTSHAVSVVGQTSASFSGRIRNAGEEIYLNWWNRPELPTRRIPYNVSETVCPLDVSICLRKISLSLLYVLDNGRRGPAEGK